MEYNFKYKQICIFDLLLTIKISNIVIILIMLNIPNYVKPNYKKQKQVISDSYRKKFYGRIPESWITPEQKQEIINKSRANMENEWDIQAIKLENYLTQDQIHSLKCHPPFSIKVTIKKESTDESSKDKEKESKDKNKLYLLIVYPRSYRTVVEDPLEPPPLDYLGSTKLLTFYIYKIETTEEEYENNKKSMKEKIIETFSLQSDGD